MKLLLGVLCLCLVSLAVLALRHRDAPARCSTGFKAMAARCCSQHQQLQGGHCTPELVPCGEGVRPPCIPIHQRIQIQAGSLRLAFHDWQSEGVVPDGEIVTHGFYIDSYEQTVAQYQLCVAHEQCDVAPIYNIEPGLPVRGLTAAQAEQHCAYLGGRLPLQKEWIFAAAGPGGNKYPWGSTGLVCRRAVYGLSDGPCGRGGNSPDAVASRPDGKTPSGIFDLVGNVSEWVRTGDAYWAMGGSYRSQLASELKTWSVEKQAIAAPHIGYRCAYDGPKTPLIRSSAPMP